MNIGVISDTHNYFDLKIEGLFKGVHHILHAGDIGMPALLGRLRKIAPVTAVFGNTDSNLTVKETEIIQLEDAKFMIHHIVDPHSPSGIVRELIKEHAPDVVIFGHTHKPFDEVIRNIRFFNPGYAGKLRFDLPRSVAILECEPGKIQSRLHFL
jgi:putative phosphoesterase